MRLGIITPIVILLPRAHNAWEVDATVDDLVAIVQAADRLGYHHLTASEHIAVPVDVDARRGKRYWDLLSTLSYVAAVTDQIRLATNMVVLPYHHPLEVVKHYGTLDRLSKGRVILGVGVGSLREEFAMLGRDLAGRGARSDDAIRAIRAAWGRSEPRYEGSHWSFGGVVVDPTGVQEHLPIWVGGRTMASLRRAVELGDAWVPFIIGPDDVRTMLDRAQETPAWVQRASPLDVALWPEPVLDPLLEPDRVVDQAHEHLSSGATILNYRFPSRSVAHHVEQMEALTTLLDPT
ncbi:MAG: TIGR03619 family F420-dependent LLM class oxidoreductase [Acidimicrobiia bacterium]